ncbi:MAG TPA: hypothetical protein VK116_10600, partial [Planctomycetota bacterium]|nr:hypothetical protein [Planctomycetota bacterium]
LATVRECFGRGADPSILLEQVIESLHDLMADLVRSNDANDAGKLDRVVGSLQILLETAARLRSSAYPDVAVEVAFLKLARLPDPRGFQRALEQLAEIESGAAAATGDRPRHAPSGFGGPSAAGPPRSTAEPVPPRPGPPRSREPDRGAPPRASGGGFAPELRGGDDSDPQPAPAVDAAAAGGSGSIGAIETGPEGSTAVSSATSADTPVDPRRLLALWDQIHIELQDRHPNIAPLVAGGAPTPHADGTLIVRLGKRFSWTQMRSGPKLAIYEELVRDVTGAPWKIRIEYDASLEGRASAPASNPYAASPESAGSAPQEAGSRPSSNGSPSARAQPTGGTSIGRPAGKLEGEIVTKAMKLFNARPV